MNENVQGPVNLAGKGYVFRTLDHYEPGDYSELINVDLTPQGTLKNRPPVLGYPIVDGGSTGVENHTQFIGSYGSDVLTSSTGWAPFRVQKHTYAQTEGYWNGFVSNVLAKSPVGTVGNGDDYSVTIVSFFTYNNSAYVLVRLVYTPRGTDDSVCALLPASAPITSVFEPPLWEDYTVGDSILDHTLTGIHVDPEVWYQDNPRVFENLVSTWMVYEDRLWFASGETVYFSKATDPTIFTVPDGGFFNFPGIGSIKSLIALNDLIYIIGDSTIRILNYETDPNTDSEIQIISETTGGEDATVLGGVIYTIKPNAIYSIIGTNVTKETDLEIPWFDTHTRLAAHDGTGQGFNDGGTFSIRLVGFGNSLYFFPRFITARKFYGSITETRVSYFDIKYSTKYADETSINTESARLFKYDLELQFLTRYDFGSEANGYPVDAMYIKVDDSSNQTKLMFIGETESLEYVRRVFSLGDRTLYPKSNGVDLDTPVDFYTTLPQYVALDTWVDVSDTTKLLAYLPQYHVRVENFSPDNLRYMTKKFRNIELEISPPVRFDGVDSGVPCMSLKVYAGDRAADGTNVTSTVLDSMLSSGALVADNPIYMETHRYGINQRCKKVTIELTSDEYHYSAFDYGADVPFYNAWELADIRTLWSYSGRGPTNDGLGS